MITKKTRLISGLAAVLMLMSLFTAFVLPVSAEESADTATTVSSVNLPDAPVNWPAEMLKGKYISTNPSAANIAITDAEDWIALVDYVNNGSGVVTKTLWFTNDIDFDADGDGVPTSVDPLGMTTAKSFQGTINGQGHKIENLLIDVALTAGGISVGLIGYSGSITVRDLSIASGTITATAEVSSECYVGHFCAFTPKGNFINCWNNADVELSSGAASCSQTAITGFGRQNSGKTVLVNCINSGDLTKGVASGRVMAFADWIKSETLVYNCINVGTLTGGGARGLVAANNTTNAALIKTYNTYYVAGKGIGSVTYGNSTKVADTTYIPSSANPVSAQVAAGAETSGELASILNENYTDPSAVLPSGVSITRAYWTVDKSGDSAMTVYGVDQYSATYSVTVSLNTGDYEISSETSYHSGGETVQVQWIDGYELDLNAEGIPLGADTGSFRMPARNVTLKYYSTTVNWDLLQEMIATYKLYMQTGFYKILVDGSMISELLEKMEMTYAMKDTMSETEAMARIAIYIQDDATMNTALKPEDEINYLDYPAVRYYDELKDVYTGSVWTVSNLDDMTKLGEVKSELSKSSTIYVVEDITFPDDYTGAATSLSGLAASIVGKKVDGTNVKISNLTVKTAWLGSYTGREVKNLTFENCEVTETGSYGAFLIDAVKANILLENIVMDGITATAGSTNGNAIVVGSLPSGGTYTLTLKDITVVNSTLARYDKGSEYFNSAIVVGKTYDGNQLIAENIYLDNNTITGNCTGNGSGIVFGEVICKVTAKNIAVFNTKVNDSEIRGVLAGLYKDTGAISVTNMIAANNGEKSYAIYNNSGFYPTAVNGLYTDTANVARYTESGKTYGVANAGAAIVNGEAAYVLNAAGVEKTWIMPAGESLPTFGTEGKPVAVTFKKLNGDESVLYTDATGHLIGLTEEFFGSVVAWNGYETLEALQNTVFTADAVIEQGECDHNYEYVPDNAGKHSIVCTTVGGCAKNELVDCSYEYTVSADGLTHAMACTVCGYATSEACTITTAHVNGTANADSKHALSCAVCGYSVEVSCEFDVAYTEHTNEINSTNLYTCSCGYSYTEDLGKTHVWSEEGTVVKLPSYNIEGTERFECTICDAYVDRATDALTGTGIVVKAPESANAGSEITVDLELANNPGIAGMNLSVAFDPAVMTLTGVENGGLFGEFVGIKDGVDYADVDGSFVLTFVNVSNLTAEDTDGKAFATLTFMINEDAAIGSSTNITVDLVKGKDEMDTANTGVSDENGQYVAVGGSAAMVTIVDYLWGDANSDGTTNIHDALLIMRYLVELVDEADLDMAAANANRDAEGVVDIHDALLIMRYLVELVEWDPYGTTTEPPAAA